MTTFSRRDMAHLLSAAIALPLLEGCFPDFTSLPSPPAPLRIPIIDAHCHIFNASDLPAARFIRYAIIKDLPKAEISTLAIQDPDLVDELLALIIWIIGQSRAPSADEEIGVLDGKAEKRVAAADSAANAAESKARVGQFIQGGPIAVEGGPPRSFDRIRQALVHAANPGQIGVSNAPLTAKDAAAVAEKSYHSDTLVGRYMRWASMFTRYRYALAEELIIEHRSQNGAPRGFEPLLLTPALVDYDKWLGEDVSASPLPRQVELMSRLSRRPDGVPIHGYVPFDPLRAAYFRKGIENPVFDPIGLVRKALNEDGFLGVKVYPPMGFRAYGNEGQEQRYADTIIKALGKGHVGHELDASLSSLYDTCVELHAPILAHAAASNGPGSLLADPAYWLPVFKKWPDLHVCLAHFGELDQISAGAPAQSLPDNSWEWTFGRYIAANPNAPVFTDVSYFSEILDTATWPHYADSVKRYLALFDPDCRHLVFGTDWIMLGREKSADIYTGTLYDFFQTACGLDKERLGRLFVGNAIRFLGLRKADATRARLAAFYGRYGLSESRLPSDET